MLNNRIDTKQEINLKLQFLIRLLILFVHFYGEVRPHRSPKPHGIHSQNFLIVLLD